MANKNTCTSEGCLKKHMAKGFCQKHYDAFRKPPKGRYQGTDEERFWKSVEKTETCWNWLGSKFSNKKYGQFKSRRQNKNWRAHRFSYEIIKGPIPKGLTLDHLCMNPICVNPAHLEPVTQLENYKRYPKQKVCSRGHDRIPGTRRCAICSEYMRKIWRIKQKNKSVDSGNTSGKS